MADIIFRLAIENAYDLDCNPAQRKIIGIHAGLLVFQDTLDANGGRMKIYLIPLVLLAVSGCATTPQNPPGLVNENLLQNFPLPNGEWVSRQKKSGNMLEIRWSQSHSKDLAQTFIIYGARREVSAYKEGDDKAGKQDCENFESNVIDGREENGYPALTWYSECRKANGYYSKTLSKVIRGNDSAYILRRIWRDTPQESDWQGWLDYYKDVTVCDSRGRGHPCPKNLKEMKQNKK